MKLEEHPPNPADKAVNNTVSYGNKPKTADFS